MTRPLLLSAALAAVAACQGCPPPGELTITTESLPPGNVDATYAAEVATAGGAAPLSFAIASGALPLGVALDPATGALRGTPTEYGTFQFGVRAAGSNGAAAVKGLAIEVLPYPPVRIVTTEVRNAVVGGSYLAILSALDGSPPYTWSVSSGTLPQGLRLTDSGSLVGSALALESRTFEVTVKDTHRIESRRQEARARLGITTFPPLVFAPAGPSLPDAYAGEPYSLAFTASGGLGPYRFVSVLSGGLPPWLTLTGAGVLSGTAPAAGPPPSALSIRVLDESRTEQLAIQDYTLAVHPLPRIATSSLPEAVQGQPYSADLLSTGGKPALQWSVPQAALPPGLTLSTSTGSTATLSGTPTASGSYAFTATLADANGRSSTQSLSLLVRAPPPPPDGGLDGGTDGGAGFDGRFFRLANWNVEWFGSAGNGPPDEALQQANVRAVIADAGYEIWALQEVADVPAFNALVAGLPGYEGVVASDPTKVAGTASCGAGGTTACWFNGEQRTALLYRADVVRFLSARLILTTSDTSFAGRPPLRVDFALDGGTGERLTVIALHMKAGTAFSDWNQRRDGGALLEGYLRASFDGGSRVAVVGDWNDDVDVSIAAGQPTPYAGFNADPGAFRFFTAPLSAAGVSSTVRYSDFVDHQLMTAGLEPWYQPGSVQRVPFTAWLSDAGTTTSDHYPIVSRFNLGGP